MYQAQHPSCSWIAWLNTVLPALKRGDRILAPGHLPDPRVCGFEVLDVAWPAGQVGDFALSLADGSRIHIHLFADGRRVVHRDGDDPKRGFLAATRHLLTETPLGPILGVALAAIGAGAIFGKK